MLETFPIVLRPPNRLDTIACNVTFVRDGYIDFDASFLPWSPPFVPDAARGPMHLVREIAEYTGSFVLFKRQGTVRVHPCVIPPILREFGSRATPYAVESNRVASERASESSVKVDANIVAWLGRVKKFKVNWKIEVPKGAVSWDVILRKDLSRGSKPGDRPERTVVDLNYILSTIGVVSRANFEAKFPSEKPVEERLGEAFACSRAALDEKFSLETEDTGFAHDGSLDDLATTSQLSNAGHFDSSGQESAYQDGQVVVEKLVGEDGLPLLWIRPSDGFFYISRMLAAHGKKFFNWKQSKDGVDYLEGIAKKLGVNEDDLIKEGRSPDGKTLGKYIHSKLLLELAGYASTPLKIECHEVLEKYWKGELTTNDSRFAALAFGNSVGVVGGGESARLSAQSDANERRAVMAEEAMSASQAHVVKREMELKEIAVKQRAEFEIESRNQRVKISELERDVAIAKQMIAVAKNHCSESEKKMKAVCLERERIMAKSMEALDVCFSR